MNIESTSSSIEPVMGTWLASRPGNPHEFIHGFQQLIDSLPEQIALLDENWQIIVVNRAWIKTAAMYGFRSLGPGANYLHFCDQQGRKGHASAAAVRDGMIEMESGLRDSFHLTYSGADRWEGHVFQLTVNRLEIDGHRFATVTRHDVTELVNLRRLREEFSSSVIESQAEERKRLARDIHDSTMQLLVGIGFAIGQLRRVEQAKDVPQVLAEMEQLLGEAQQEIRSISYLAHPPTLEKLGLHAALKTLVEGYGRRTELATSFHSEGDIAGVGHGCELAIYRLVQEALLNVHRHAHAREVVVGLFCRKDTVHVVIVDDGIGVRPDLHRGVGLAGMRERVAELGGRLFVRSRSPGTAVIASFPRGARTRAVGDLAVHV